MKEIQKLHKRDSWHRKCDMTRDMSRIILYVKHSYYCLQFKQKVFIKINVHIGRNVYNFLHKFQFKIYGHILCKFLQI